MIKKFFSCNSFLFTRFSQKVQHTSTKFGNLLSKHEIHLRLFDLGQADYHSVKIHTEINALEHNVHIYSRHGTYTSSTCVLSMKIGFLLQNLPPHIC